MIRCTGVYYRYPQRSAWALSDVTQTVAERAFLLVTGDSGAGKSSWLRTLNGIVPHFTGGVFVGKVMVAGRDVLREGSGGMSQWVGFVGQNPETQAILDVVEDEIAFGLEQRGVAWEEMQRRVERVLVGLRLEPLRHRPIRTLSGGERQRVAVAAALVLHPHLLILDEPTSQLDPTSADLLCQLIAELHRDHAITVIIAEHRHERILPYATQQLHFAQGRLVAPPPAPAPIAWRPSPQISPAPLLKADGLVVGYERDRPILSGLALALHGGEIVAITGENGAGKTTLLKSMVNLLPRQRGGIWLGDEEIGTRKSAELCRHIAYLPQNPDDLLFAETVYDELLITLQNHRLPIPPRDQLERLLTSLGLADVADHYPRDLSTGQRQRVALAALLVTTPAILLLDEPTRGLDPQRKRELGQLLWQLRDQGQGILLVTHDLAWVNEIATRALRLHNGILTPLFTREL